MAWNNSQQSASDCLGNWCVSGELFYENGATYANISWHSTDEPIYCSIFITPAPLDWVGDWFVTQSQENENCGVPVNNSIVNIQAYGINF